MPKNTMAAKGTTKRGTGLQHTTPYQLHKSQVPALSVLREKIIDFTEHKLTRYLLTLQDLKQQLVLADVINMYAKGDVVVAWRAGHPVWFKVQKEN